MALNVSAATARIRRQLRDAEAKVDAAIQSSAMLMATMLEARSIEGVEVHTGQKAILRLSRAQQSLVDGSSDIFRVHDEMVKVGREMGIFEEETPPSGINDEDVLRRVAA